MGTDKKRAALTKANRTEMVASLLVFLSGREEDLQRFFALSGVDPDDLRARIFDDAFQAGVFDYVLGNEPLLLAFCEENGHLPNDVVRLAQDETQDHGDWM